MSDAYPTPGASFGRTLVAVAVAAAPELEADHGKRDQLAEADMILGKIISHVLAGEAPTAEATTTRTSTTLRLPVLSDADLSFIRDRWTVEHHEQSGFWSLPDAITVHPGLANLPHYQRLQPAFFSSLAFGDTAKLDAAAFPEAVYLWGQVEPLLEAFFIPLRLRGPGIIQKPDKRDAGWADFDQFAAAISLTFDDAFEDIRDGERWLTLTRPEQIDRKTRYLDQVRAQVSAADPALLRAAALRPLIDRYYAKAGKGPVLRKAVLTRPLQRTLSGYFAGDWQAFLDYLGEPLHPEEELVTALPEPRILAATAARAEEVAAATGVSTSEVEAIVAAFWGQQRTTSPPELRVAALKNLWADFDRLHAEQRPGMPTLASLVAEHENVTFPLIDHGPYYPQPMDAYRLLAPERIDELIELWGTTVMPQHPDRIVSESFPIIAAEYAFSTPLVVWHALAMAAWMTCESMTNEEQGFSLPNVYYDQFRSLEASETPITRDVFTDVRAALPRLGKPVSIDAHTETKEIGPGLTLSITMSGGPMRRDGFEILRDIITRHRRAWAAAYLDQYLAAEWPADLRDVAEQYNHMTADKGKPPTARQFAKIATPIANAWFGGDLAAVAVAIGTKTDIRTESSLRLPHDRPGFAYAVFTELGGPETAPRDIHDYSANLTRYHAIEKLAGQGFRYVQLLEALGRPPDLKEFGRSIFQVPSAQALDKDIDHAWTQFTAAVERALASQPAATQPAEPRSTAPPASPSVASVADHPEQPRSLLGRLFGQR